MTIENNSKDDTIRLFLTRQAALETVLTHFMIAVSMRLDPDARLIQGAMIAAEDDLMATKRMAGPQELETATEAVAYFLDYSTRLIAAITPKDVKN